MKLFEDLQSSWTKCKPPIWQRAEYRRNVEAYEQRRDTEYQEERGIDIVGVSPGISGRKKVDFETKNADRKASP